MLREIAFQAVLFLTNIIQTVTGFAGAMLAMPFAIQLVGVEEAKAVVNISTAAVSAAVTVKNHGAIHKKTFAKITFWMLLGLVAGAWIFTRFPQKNLLLIYAVLIIAVGINKLFHIRSASIPKPAEPVILFLAGVVHGAFLSGGALLIIFAVDTLKDKNEFRTTVSAMWVILNAILLVVYWKSGYYTPRTCLAVLVSVLLTFASRRIGNVIYRKINQRAFLNLVYVLILTAGVTLLLNR